jgi:hypothetical protein
MIAYRRISVQPISGAADAEGRRRPRPARRRDVERAIYTLRFESMSDEENRRRRAVLHAHATRPEIACRLR